MKNHLDDSSIQQTLNLIREALDTSEFTSPLQRLLAIEMLINTESPTASDRRQAEEIAREV